MITISNKPSKHNRRNKFAAYDKKMFGGLEEKEWQVPIGNLYESDVIIGRFTREPGMVTNFRECYEIEVKNSHLHLKINKFDVMALCNAVRHAMGMEVPWYDRENPKEVTSIHYLINVIEGGFSMQQCDELSENKLGATVIEFTGTDANQFATCLTVLSFHLCAHFFKIMYAGDVPVFEILKAQAVKRVRNNGGARKEYMDALYAVFDQDWIAKNIDKTWLVDCGYA